MVADRTVYVSGCLGLDKSTMQLVPGGATAQAEMALKNLEAVLKAADSGVDKVIKNTVFLKDLNDFGAVNEVYKRGESIPIAYYTSAADKAAASAGLSAVLIKFVYHNNIYDQPYLYSFSVFNKDFPARSCFQVAKLPMDALVEIECIALTGPVHTVTVE